MEEQEYLCTVGGVQFSFERVNLQIHVEIIMATLFLTKKKEKRKSILWLLSAGHWFKNYYINI